MNATIRIFWGMKWFTFKYLVDWVKRVLNASRYTHSLLMRRWFTWTLVCIALHAWLILSFIWAVRVHVISIVHWWRSPIRMIIRVIRFVHRLITSAKHDVRFKVCIICLSSSKRLFTLSYSLQNVFPGSRAFGTINLEFNCFICRIIQHLRSLSHNWWSSSHFCTCRNVVQKFILFALWHLNSLAIILPIVSIATSVVAIVMIWIMLTVSCIRILSMVEYPIGICLLTPLWHVLICLHPCIFQCLMSFGS